MLVSEPRLFKSDWPLPLVDEGQDEAMEEEEEDKGPTAPNPEMAARAPRVHWLRANVYRAVVEKTANKGPTAAAEAPSPREQRASLATPAEGSADGLSALGRQARKVDKGKQEAANKEGVSVGMAPIGMVTRHRASMGNDPNAKVSQLPCAPMSLWPLLKIRFPTPATPIPRFPCFHFFCLISVLRTYTHQRLRYANHGP